MREVHNNYTANALDVLLEYYETYSCQHRIAPEYFEPLQTQERS